ncbi:hypothetical protein [Chryseobacterium potabilaquae]|uniref:Uncharacterized protein n=1 Tax=Chryseobacterium potabilaquae TaxID=2675057 RepID=A0A6N4XC58_9FLAO|nr:hypothetical protein [Chryseobacterium potabilaquae]CAA7197049.1 hypothetical protein CHRY9293_03106 [Chryseobacterium potabilaquae]
MKKFLALTALFFGIIANAQLDKIYRHNGETIEGKVLKVEEYNIVFKYDGEDTENSLSKYAVEKIVYTTGRTENMTKKIVVKGKDDWEKVMIIEDKAYLGGLKKGDEIRGKTGFISYHTGNTADKKAEKKLKIEAAEKGMPFIFMLESKDINQTGYKGKAFGNVQSIKKGITYNY